MEEEESTKTYFDKKLYICLHNSPVQFYIPIAIGQQFIINDCNVPYKEADTVKLYYTIGEVSEMFHVNTSLVRFWEKEFDVLKPKKNKKGNRLFTPEDLENFKIIHNLVKEQGLTLEGAKKYLKENRKALKHELKTEKSQFSEIENKLRGIRRKLLELQNKI